MKFVSLFFLSLVLSCQSTPFERGLRESYSYYKPASLVFLPVIAFEKEVEENPEVKSLLENLTQEILGDFENQSFLQGFGPAYTTKVLTDLGHGNPREKIQSFFEGHSFGGSFLSFYEEHLENDPRWHLLLKELTVPLNYSDAVFLAVLTNLSEKQINDRGLQVSKRSVSLSFLLVEVESATAVWSETKELSLSHKQLPSPPAFAYPEYPSWQNFQKKLIVRSLWKEFPAWQF